MIASAEIRPEAETSHRPAAMCPVCSGRESVFYCHGHDRLFGIAEGEFELRRCTGCDCVFQWPVPEAETLSSFYPEGYWWEESDPRPLSSPAGLIGRLERVYREFVTRDHVGFLEQCARREKSTGRKLLDIGCGNGTFLSVARSRGFECYGLDVSERAVRLARSRYDLRVRCGDIGSDAWEGQRFDFITMFHVLEHVSNPEVALSYAAGLLAPGGSVIVQVPNMASVQARLFGRRWYGLDVPRHVVNFSPKSLDLLLRSTGFSIRSTRRFSLRDNPALLASSAVPWLDPVGRKVRHQNSGSVARGILELVYFGVFVLALPLAWLEASLGRGGTLWIQAGRAGESGRDRNAVR